MTARKLVTGTTLVALVVVVCVMAVWGYHAVTAPIEDSGATGSTGPTCAPEDRVVTKYVRRTDVTVSVYNAGDLPRRAQDTMSLLEHAGFKPGEVANAPDGIDVDRAVVYSTQPDDPAAELVAKVMGKNVQVVHSDEELGPGVDVVIGDKFKRLNPAAPTRLELPKPKTSCVRSTS